LVSALPCPITVETEFGRGTTFVIELPALTRPAPVPGPADVEAWRAITPKAMLVVDDEPNIAATLAKPLQRDGHQVDIATRGLMALEMLARRRSYDLVLSDTPMPNLDGKGFYRHLERRFPGQLQRLIFTTGDLLDREKRAFLESTGVPYLAKLFDLSEVRTVVHRVLAGASVARSPQP
jgi:CheY-like chemotaxis protein